MASRIITHLKSSRSLYIMCHIPVFCWMAATVLEFILTEAETLSLEQLAFQQLEKGNLIFYEKDLRECDITGERGTRPIRLFDSNALRFIHCSVLPDSTRLLHQTAVDLALQNENGHLDHFLRFPLGLSLESNEKLLQDLLQQTGSSSLNKETVKYTKKKIREAPNPERCINLFHCLNELNDHSLVEEVQGYLRKGHKPGEDLSLSQLSALAFVLLVSDQELEEFDLGDYGGWSSPARSDAGLLRMLPGVQTSSIAVCEVNE
ncbi:hypothetical protein ACEWY4_006055 [Coilia grayii]|uniref:Uncharacterized protein n=1 Tax=Coilia grayii TaxID=363190 RepID=A0ABD1KCK9_9TELE